MPDNYWRFLRQPPSAKPGEEPPLILRPHPAILVPPVAMALCGLIVAATLSATWAAHNPGRSLFVWSVWVLLFLRLLWKTIQWSLTYFAIGSDEILLYSGVIRRTVTPRPLTKVINIRLYRSPQGRMFGYGEMHFESMSQQMPFWMLRYTPYPAQIFMEIYEKTFPGSAESGEALGGLSKYDRLSIESLKS